MSETTITLPKVSYKEVHKEFNLEADFLGQKRNGQEFREKGEFLTTLGFGRSIAARMYLALEKSNDLFAYYQQRYPNSKFIIEEQLERVCEKYDLYVRPQEFYIGDIPERNVRDLMNFRFYGNDVDSINFRTKGRDGHITQYNTEILFHQFSKNAWPVEQKNDNGVLFSLDFEPRVSQHIICFAAVKALFSPEAFKESNKRIIGREEALPKMQVDTDPIVMLRVKGGYLVITAWGDEANDEITVNQKLN